MTWAIVSSMLIGFGIGFIAALTLAYMLTMRSIESDAPPRYTSEPPRLKVMK